MISLARLPGAGLNDSKDIMKRGSRDRDWVLEALRGPPPEVCAESDLARQAENSCCGEDLREAMGFSFGTGFVF